MKIGFIGIGNMATAIIRGIITTDFVSADDVYLYDIEMNQAQAIAEQTGSHLLKSSRELVKAVDVVVLSIKPNIIESVLLELKPLILEKAPLFVSIAAGTPTDKLYNYLKTDQPIPIIRVMPNINVLVGEGATAVCGHDFATNEQIDYILNMFRSVGKAWRLAEKDFSTFTALAGSSPAYAYLFIDSIARAGVKHGLPKVLATEMAAQAVLGSAQMILESDENPWTLIDQVCSPGGTTVAGLLTLEEEGFMSAVVKGIDTTIARDEEMNQE